MLTVFNRSELLMHQTLNWCKTPLLTASATVSPFQSPSDKGVLKQRTTQLFNPNEIQVYRITTTMWQLNSRSHVQQTTAMASLLHHNKRHVHQERTLVNHNKRHVHQARTLVNHNKRHVHQARTLVNHNKRHVHRARTLVNRSKIQKPQTTVMVSLFNLLRP